MVIYEISKACLLHLSSCWIDLGSLELCTCAPFLSGQDKQINSDTTLVVYLCFLNGATTEEGVHTTGMRCGSMNTRVVYYAS